VVGSREEALSLCDGQEESRDANKVHLDYWYDSTRSSILCRHIRNKRKRDNKMHEAG
jgi:hypothetical protein